MEIKDYLDAIRERIWLPIGLPIVAAILTMGFVLLQPVQYQAAATVIVPSLSAKGYSTSAVTQYVSTFKDVLNSAPVLDKVANQVGVSEKNLVGTLTADTATASSNVITVTYQGHDKALATTIAKDAAVDAMDALEQPSLAQSDAQVAATQIALNKANQAELNFTTTTGLLSPDQDYRIQDQAVSQLLVQLQQAKLAGDSSRASGLQEIISARQKNLATLAAQVTQYESLKQSVTAAQSAYNRAVQEQAAAQASIASDHSSAAVSARLIGHVSRLSSGVKFVGIAIAVALLLSLAYIVLMELLHPARPVAMSSLTAPKAGVHPAPEAHLPNNGYPAATRVAPGSRELQG